MRPIKFRAWNGYLKEMWYPNTFRDIENLMQFTGLHDKNGKEIWEGDVVRVQLSIPRTGTVEYIDRPFAGFCVRLDTGVPFQMIELGNEKEVLGNIYENPDLIK